MIRDCETRMPSQIKMKDWVEVVTIKVASPTKLHSWSFGEVKKAETFSLKALHPIEDGLFCCKIFGPLKDFECSCRKYRSPRFSGVICEECGVEITFSDVRKERMGHIRLALPVYHIWFLKTSSLVLGSVLGKTPSEIERLLYYEAHIIIDPKTSKLPSMSIMLTDDIANCCSGLKDKPKTKSGAKAIRHLLQLVNIEKLRLSLEEDLELLKPGQNGIKIAERLATLKNLQGSEVDPEWLILDIIPVLPPDQRPVVSLEEGKFVTTDLNDLYCKILNRNGRLERLIFLKAPQLIIQNEKRMLQEAVDRLIDNGRRVPINIGLERRPHKSLTEMLKGKTGRFRQNLLGKRVDFSGRTVITVGPELKLHQCGIPKQIISELFRPFFTPLDSLGRNKKDNSLTQPQKIEWSEIVKNYSILLNRAPTLHRLGIQAFDPIVIDGKAIQLNPLVCSAFNADFDGDQMAVHLPLTTEAQIEAKVLMSPINNPLLPTNDRPAFLPTQEAVLGLYFGSKEEKRWHTNSKCPYYSSVENVEKALWVGSLKLNELINVLVTEKLKIRNKLIKSHRSYNTTAGRCLLFRLLPEGLSFNLFNRAIKKKDLSEIVYLALNRCKASITAYLVEKMLAIGFEIATRSGLSLSISNFCIPKIKSDVIENTIQNSKLLSRKEDKIVLWASISDFIKDRMLKEMEESLVQTKQLGQIINPVFIIADSGARGSVAQIRQMAGMRGLMVKPDGSILETPITANFREGLNTIQYFISAHGARKGLADTALKTANSGYLTRRLADVSHSITIKETDCGTSLGLKIFKTSQLETDFEYSIRNSVGRFLTDHPIQLQPQHHDLPIKKGELEELMLKKEKNYYSIRSPATCESVAGICSKCYGYDLSHKSQSNVGEAVGIIAAQSIGEPGTQLTMRTFHIGGTASFKKQLDKRAQTVGHVQFGLDLKFIRTHKNKNIVVSKSGTISIINKAGMISDNFIVPYGSVLSVKNYETVVFPFNLFFRHSNRTLIFSEVEGRIKFGVEDKKNITKKAKIQTHLVMLVRDASYQIAGLMVFPTTAVTLSIMNCQQLKVGQVIGQEKQTQKQNKDITSGVILISDLFEIRNESAPQVLAEASGIIHINPFPNRIEIMIIGSKTTKMKIPIQFFGQQTALKNLQQVGRGEVLVEGAENYYDILRLRGTGPLINSILRAVQQIYRTQDVEINNKHIEIVIKQMLRFVIIITEGSTKFFKGEQLERTEVIKLNQQIEKLGKQPATFKPMLLGISKSSLMSKSFLSGASFQETAKILAKAASLGCRDTLFGLKENVIVGRMIPAGTGLLYHQNKNEIL
ncbi:DNA-directed RNA polymerase subunit beta prime [Candidatus Tremblaya phenacola PAVE]|nr:DNA-directed RNA polymerase subunit beta prime [Candidatus Tremblaya phenacola PAVE]